MDENENRYWISYGIGENTKELQNLFKELKSIGFEENNTGDGVVRKIETEDTTLIKNIVDKTREIVHRYFPEDVLESVTVRTQPKCPHCNTYTRFRDTHCSDCGAELIPSEIINF